MTDNTFTVKDQTTGEERTLRATAVRYVVDDTLAIILESEFGEPEGTLSVNLSDWGYHPEDKRTFFVDHDYMDFGMDVVNAFMEKFCETPENGIPETVTYGPFGCKSYKLKLKDPDMLKRE